MKKKALVIVGIILAIVLLFPIPRRLKDGGTVKYQAVFYSISDVHRLSLESETGYEEGMIIEILGVEIYNSVN
jgi:hypothetical protein